MRRPVRGLGAGWFGALGKLAKLAQGSPISPLLANLFLHPLDRLVAFTGCTMVRYADDFVVLAASERELRAARAVVASLLNQRGLALNKVKTRVVPPGRAFAFLGQTLCAPAPPPET